MKKIILLLFISLFLSQLTYAQDREKYAELIKEAWNLYESKEYLQSGQTYAKAFEALEGNAMRSDRYNAACSWALADRPEEAFEQLFKTAEVDNYANLSHLTTDGDLNALHEDKRWNKLIDIVKANKEKAEANLDKPLVAQLDSIYQEDQKYRQQINAINEKYGWESPEMKAHWKIIAEKDSLNLIQVEKILEERGWLGPDIIGNKGNSTLFLVVQHAELPVQEKYLPMMREAVKIGNARASSLALLEDRIALRKGEKQIYGSQIGRDKETEENYVLPLTDPDNVDKRRAEVGLGSLQEYISNWDMTWNAEEYKRKLPEYEAKQKQ